MIKVRRYKRNVETRFVTDKDQCKWNRGEINSSNFMVLSTDDLLKFHYTDSESSGRRNLHENVRAFRVRRCPIMYSRSMPEIHYSHAAQKCGSHFLGSL